MPEYIETKLKLNDHTLLTADAAAATDAVLAVVEKYNSKFLVPLKRNQKLLFYATLEQVLRLEALIDDEGVSEYDKLPTEISAPPKCHGRLEVRVCKVLSGENLKFLEDEDDLKDNKVLSRIKSIAVVDKTITSKVDGELRTKTSRRFYITNIEGIEPEYVLTIRSKHWGIDYPEISVIPTFLLLAFACQEKGCKNFGITLFTLLKQQFYIHLTLTQYHCL